MDEQAARTRLAELDLDAGQVDDMIACAKEYGVGTLITRGVSTEYDRTAQTFSVITADPGVWRA